MLSANKIKFLKSLDIKKYRIKEDKVVLEGARLIDEALKNKILFAGIDLISNYLTGDINITSPTGLKNYKDLTGVDLSIDIWNYLESKL